MVGPDDVERTCSYLKQSFEAMLRRLRDPSGLTAMDDFEMTTNIQRCPYCSFKGICPQGSLTPTNEPPPEEDSCD